jgi:type I restriction enzyme S subunit
VLRDGYAGARAKPVDGLWELPERWEWKRLGEIAEINPKTDLSNLSTETRVTFVPMAAVSEESGRIDLSGSRAVSDV